MLTAVAGSLGFLAVPLSAAAEVPNVVTSIKPLHSIAAAVMEGVGTPQVLVDGAASPHGFSLKPSQAFLLQGADAVFWIGEDLEPSLQKPIISMTGNERSVELMQAAGIQHLEFRDSADFDAHDHGHGDAHEEEHENHDQEEGEHANHSGDEHDHDHGDSHDPHIWLNPDNGIAIAGIMAETLAGLDPENADRYRQNAQSFSDQISQIDAEIRSELTPLSGKKFIVFHDAYHHFEHHFGLEASGAITVSPDALSSADRISDIRERIRDLDVTCVFQEPQFDAKLVSVVLEGSGARTGVLDPLGTELANGPDLYPGLLKGLSKSLSECLSNQS